MHANFGKSEDQARFRLEFIIINQQSFSQIVESIYEYFFV